MIRPHQPTKFELVINLKAAKAIGLTIPSSVLDGKGLAFDVSELTHPPSERFILSARRRRRLGEEKPD